MDERERFEETRRWLRFGLQDLTAAEVYALNRDIAAHQVCFNSQQSAEKAIKAALIFEDILVPRTHELASLIELLPDSWQIKTNHPDISRLTNWAIEARYPGDWDEPTTKDATLAVQTARAVYEMVTADLRQRGFAIDE